jgi:hypothetical protein
MVIKPRPSGGFRDYGFGPQRGPIPAADVIQVSLPSTEFEPDPEVPVGATVLAAGWKSAVGHTARSLNGTNWLEVASFTPKILDIAHGANTWIAVDEFRMYISANDGLTWAFTGPDLTESLVLDEFIAVSYGLGRFVALTIFGVIYESISGDSWTPTHAITDTVFGYGGLALDFVNGRFFAGWLSDDGFSYYAITANSLVGSLDWSDPIELFAATTGTLGIPSHTPLKFAHNGEVFAAAALTYPDADPNDRGYATVDTSADGLTWTGGTPIADGSPVTNGFDLGFTASPEGVFYLGASEFDGLGASTASRGNVWASANGTSWAIVFTHPTSVSTVSQFHDITWVESLGLFIAGGFIVIDGASFGEIWTSTDGSDWTKRTDHDFGLALSASNFINKVVATS